MINDLKRECILRVHQILALGIGILSEKVSTQSSHHHFFKYIIYLLKYVSKYPPLYLFTYKNTKSDLNNFITF